MKMRNYRVSTPLGELDLRLADTSTVGELLEWLLTNDALNRGDILELVVNGQTVRNELTFGMLNLPDGTELMVLATGTSV